MLQITSSRRAAAVRAVASGAHRRFISTEYLHTTKIPTYHFQDSLPRLPIPALEKTAARYIKSATPLLSMHELASTQKAMDEFVAGAGARLQKEIVERDKTRYSSFITDAWFDMYLCNRDPLPLNINPQLTFHDDPIPEKNDQATRAAVLAYSTARFMRTLEDQKLKPDMFHTQKCMGGVGKGFFSFLNGKGGGAQYETVCSLTPKKYAFYPSYVYGTYPLDMSQYRNLFHSTRIPRAGKDELKKFARTKHMVVQRGNDFWTVDLVRESGALVPPGEVLSALQHIMKQPINTSGPALGALTTMNRDAWAAARDKLVSVPSNALKVDMIDSALFALTLEDHQPV